MVAKIVVASGKAYCRGGWVNCKYRTQYWPPNKIQRGEKCLTVSIYAAGGYATAFYCTDCMVTVLGSFANAIEDSKKDVRDL